MCKWSDDRGVGGVWRESEILKQTEILLFKKNETLKMHNFFYLWDRVAENWRGDKLGQKGGNFENFLKRWNIFTSLSLNKGWEYFSKKYSTRIKTALSALRECEAKDFFFYFSKAVKTNETDDICFKCKTYFTFKNKSNTICIEKTWKINHGTENRCTVNSNTAKLCVSL